MNPVVRSILAVIAGVIVFLAMIVFFDGMTGLIHPPPADINWQDREAVREHIETLPAAAFLLVLFGWESGAFFGGAICAWLAGRAHLVHAGIIGCLVLVGTWHNIQELPHPPWMELAGITLPLPMSLLAGSLVMLRKPRKAELSRSASTRT